jgi:TetR/AcrR family tetracycline transcriptional repressor
MAQAPTTATRGERLSRERILDAARALVEQDGLESLSMRRLAHDLDVWPMSLYRYFQDKEELVAALADAATQEIASPSPDGPWREQIRDLLRQVRAILERHPGSLRPQDGGPAATRVREAGLAILNRAGIGGEEAEGAWRALLAYTAGTAAFSSTTDEFEYGLARLLDGLERDRSGQLT